LSAQLEAFGLSTVLGKRFFPSLSQREAIMNEHDHQALKPDGAEKDAYDKFEERMREIGLFVLTGWRYTRRGWSNLTFHQRLAHVVTVVTLVVLVIYTSYTIKIYKATGKSADAAKNAADTAAKQLELTSRPWVDIDVFISAPVTYGTNGVNIGFTFVVKNIGQSPAQNVSIAPRLIPGGMGTDVHERQQHVCEDQAAAHDEFLRYVLFPNRSFSQPLTIAMTNSELDSQWPQ